MEALETLRRADHVICDFDGVIADSEDFQLRVWSRLLREEGISVEGLGVELIAGVPDRLAIERLVPGRAAEAYDSWVREKKRRCREGGATVPPVPGIGRFLASLRGAKPLHICSGSPAGEIAAFLDRHFPEVAVRQIVGQGDYPHPKPHPAPYLAVLDRGGLVAGRAVVIEDSRPGLDSARAAGLAVIHFDRYGTAADGVPRVSSAGTLARWRDDR